MRNFQRLLSDIVKLFIGPHEEDSPAHSWWTIVLVLGFFGFLIAMLNLFGA